MSHIAKLVLQCICKHLELSYPQEIQFDPTKFLEEFYFDEIHRQLANNRARMLLANMRRLQEIETKILTRLGSSLGHLNENTRLVLENSINIRIKNEIFGGYEFLIETFKTRIKEIARQNMLSSCKLQHPIQLNVSSVAVLESWYGSNRSFPYPTMQQLEALQVLTGIAIKEIKEWLQIRIDQDQQSAIQVEIQMEPSISVENSSMTSPLCSTPTSLFDASSYFFDQNLWNDSIQVHELFF